MFKKILDYLLMLFLFLLPWQTRWIYQAGELNGGYWEYGTFSLYGAQVLLWFVIVLFAVYKFARREFWTRILSREHFKTHRLNLLFGLLTVLLLAFFTMHSLNWQISYNFVFYILGGMCLALIIPQYNQTKKLIIALWLSGVGQGLLAIWQFLSQGTLASKWLGLAAHLASDQRSFVMEFGGERWLRAYGSFGSPNSLGIYLAVIFILGLYLYSTAAKKSFKILLAVGQLVVLSGLLFSFSRGSWLAAVAGVVSYFLVMWRVQTGGLWPAVRPLVYATMLVVVILIIFQPFFGARFNLNNRVEIKSINERKTQLLEAKEIFLQNKILGVGPGVYTLALRYFYPTRPAWQYQPAHNIYALTLVEYGALGFIFWAGLYIFFLRKIIKNNLAFLPVIITLLAAGLFDHWLGTMFTGIMLWWITWGLTVPEIA